MCQDAIDRWCASVMMFGPNDDESPNSARDAMEDQNAFSNGDLRATFCRYVCGPAKILNMTLPDRT